jgi:predicted amino acid racemase
MTTPRLEIDLKKIAHNTRRLVDLFGARGISVMGVTKCMLGEPRVARAMVRAGAAFIGDSRIDNIRRMRQSGVEAVFALIRSPLMSQVEEVVRHADISLNSELSVLKELSAAAERMNKVHKVVLMVDLGDLREGLPPEELPDTVTVLRTLPGLSLIGLGTNLGCIGGVAPTAEKMAQLSDLAENLEQTFGFDLEIVSGGNSANFNWFLHSGSTGRINNLRIGEMIFLGHETLDYTPVEGLFTDSLTLAAEVIELKHKASVPSGEIASNAFGQAPRFRDRGPIRRAVLGLGRQDVTVSGLTPLDGIEIMGSSSDHIVVDAKDLPLQVGDELRFRLDYGALLAAMTSPFVEKVFLHEEEEGTKFLRN